MGIEAQLFYVKLHEPMPYGGLKKILVKLDCNEADNFGSLEKGFEIASSRGIVELLLHSDKKGDVSEMSVRFSLLNPDTIVNLTLHFLESLAKIISCDIYIAQPQRKIDPLNMPALQDSMIEKIRYFVKISSVRQKPIRAGDETFDYVRTHKRKEGK